MTPVNGKKNGQNHLPKSLLEDVKDFAKESKWLEALIKASLDQSVDLEAVLLRLPKLGKSNYAKFISENKLTLEDRVLLLITLVNSNMPDFLALQFRQPTSKATIQTYRQFRLHDEQDRIKPTLATVAQLLAGGDQFRYAAILYQFEHHSKIINEKIVNLIPASDDYEAFPEHIIRIDPAYESHFCRGSVFRLDNVKDFHARKLETKKRIKDLVLNDKTQLSLMALVDYMRVAEKSFAREDFAARINKGFVALFHGYPGTGKTYSASIIANEVGMPLYYVDTAAIVSKYVGETAKNLKNIFERLQGQNCALYFDEADAIFGKRTTVQDAKDRYGNQEISYLLQAIEQFDGVVILSTNFPDNIDMAFRRRIHLMVHFEPPEEEKRLQLWKYYFPKKSYKLKPAKLLDKIARNYTVTGANIANVVKLACIEAEANGDLIVDEEMILRHMSSEYYKDGRNLNNPHAFSWEKMKGMG